MYERIKKILEENFEITDLSPDADIKADLGLNSFDLMELICIVEDELGIEIEEEKYRGIGTVGEMCKYLEEEYENRNGGH